LYFIYKVCNVITLANELNQKYKEHHFVPVYWMGSEDHDFEEINHIYLSGKKIEWHSSQGGATGEYTLENITPFFNSIKDFFSNNPEALEIISDFETYFNTSKNLTEATFKYLHELFGKYGLIIVDGNNSAFKKVFTPIIELELTKGKTDEIVKQTQQKLIDAGYHAQAHSRPINMFYKIENLRERIVFESGLYKVNNTEIEFTREQILSELNNYPERFSPNVILRPLFQQTILPNVMYVGGGGELAYWMQLKEVFHLYKVQYPMLVLRTSAHIISQSISKRIQKFDFPLSAYFGNLDELKKEFLALSDKEGILQIGEEQDMLKSIIESLRAKAEKLDLSLVGWIGAEGTKMEKSLEHILGRLIKTKKGQVDVQMQQLEKIVTSFTPENSLQERIENFLPYYIKYNSKFIELLIEKLNPMDKEFTIVEEV
jgi:bacillithiol synthase